MPNLTQRTLMKPKVTPVNCGSPRQPPFPYGQNTLAFIIAFPRKGEPPLYPVKLGHPRRSCKSPALTAPHVVSTQIRLEE